jgi:DNA-binding transcriptional ArsR family regulator
MKVMKGFIVNEKGKRLYYSDSLILENPHFLQLIANPQRIEILKMLSKQELYASEIAKKLNIHEQKIYYHINKLLEADVLEVVERREIRGTTAKTYRPKAMNFSLLMDFQGKPLGNLVSKEIDPKLKSFLEPFIVESELNSTIIVGNPDPHGAYKARARDGHYAIDLALFLGQYSHFPKDFRVKLDVDLTELGQNLIVIGGPAANLVANNLNSHFLAKIEAGFSEKKPFGIISRKMKREYSEENIGIVARTTNPFDETKKILFLAGISSVGTKAAVIAMTRHHDSLLSGFKSENDYYSIIQGFDLDGDGKIDSAEILEQGGD